MSLPPLVVPRSVEDLQADYAGGRISVQELEEALPAALRLEEALGEVPELRFGPGVAITTSIAAVAGSCEVSQGPRGGS